MTLNLESFFFTVRINDRKLWVCHLRDTTGVNSKNILPLSVRKFLKKWIYFPSFTAAWKLTTTSQQVLNWERWIPFTHWFLRSLLAPTLFSHLSRVLLSCLCHLCIRDQFYMRFFSSFAYSSSLTFLNFMALIVYGKGYVLWKASSFLQGWAHPCNTEP
jgi:hypothetical protein